MPSKTYYFILRGGSDVLNNVTSLAKIESAIKRQMGGVYTVENVEAQFYEDLNKAKRTCRLNSEEGGIDAIAELTLTSLPTENEHNIDYAAALVKVHHMRGFEVRPEDIDPKLHESKHVANLQQEIKDETSLEMNCSPNELLLRLPKELYYLLFVDYQLFYHLRETWVQYEKREPNCIKNLFDAISLNVLPYFSTPDAMKAQVSLEQIKSMHRRLSQTLPNKTLTPGEIRKELNAFPINTNSASVAGITELLFRIKKDNNQDGFMIADMKKTYLVNFFMRELGEYGFDEHEKYLEGDKTNLPTRDRLKEAKTQIIAKIFSELQKKFPTITLEQVTAVVESAWIAYGVEKNIKESWKDYAELFYQISKQALRGPTKEEHQLDVILARSTPIAAAGSQISGQANLANMSDQEIKHLATQIFNRLESEPTISIFAPKAQLAINWAQKAIEEYNEQIVTAKSPAERIGLVDQLTHEIEILHLFSDVNCRTAYLIMNQLLLANGIMWSILYNPNRIDAYSAQERQEQMAMGIHRFLFLCNNDSFIDYNNRLLTTSGPVSNSDFIDAEVADRRKNFLAAFQRHYANLVESLVAKLTAKQDSSPHP